MDRPTCQLEEETPQKSSPVGETRSAANERRNDFRVDGDNSETLRLLLCGFYYGSPEDIETGLTCSARIGDHRWHSPAKYLDGG